MCFWCLVRQKVIHDLLLLDYLSHLEEMQVYYATLTSHELSMETKFSNS